MTKVKAKAMSLGVVCVGTETKGFLAYLAESCRRYNVSFTQLLKGQKWTYLESEMLPDYILFVDAYDTILLGDPHQLIADYERVASGKVWMTVEDASP